MQPVLRGELPRIPWNAGLKGFLLPGSAFSPRLLWFGRFQWNQGVQVAPQLAMGSARVCVAHPVAAMSLRWCGVSGGIRDVPDRLQLLDLPASTCSTTQVAVAGASSTPLR